MTGSASDSSLSPMELWKFALMTLGLLLPFCIGSKCPDNCSCSNDAFNISVLCTSEKITIFPPNLPQQSLAVNVEFTNVSSIGPTVFAGLIGLEELHLSNNKLKVLPDGLFEGLPKLHTLDLTNNLLEDLPVGIFNTCLALKSLVLTGNRLTSLNATWLQPLVNLEWLDISRNGLRSIAKDCFLSMRSLKTLDLSDNDLQVLPDGLFSGLHKLERLNLENTNLRSISEVAFVQTPNLMYLFMQHNHLKKLPAMVLHPLSLLDTLDLSHNILSSVPCRLFQQNLKLGRQFGKGVDLSWNPWHCDHRLAYLRQWVDDHTSTLYSTKNTLCAAPKELEGQSLMEVTLPNIKQSC